MPKHVEIITQGQCREVTEAMLNDLRTLNLSWYAYCQARLTRNHVDAIAYMTRYRRD